LEGVVDEIGESAYVSVTDGRVWRDLFLLFSVLFGRVGV
jgi:hypothetical protein